MQLAIPHHLYASACLLLFSSALIEGGRVTNPSKAPKNAVLLSKVSTLTLHPGKVTASRRVSPVPQMRCVGPKEICKLYEVDVPIRCTNDGSDYDAENIQWSCRASLPEEFKLGSTDVSCEGYESSEDPYVLKGSCGIEYRLLLTDLGEAKYKIKPSKAYDSESAAGTNEGEKWAGYAFMVLFAVVAFVILGALCQSWQNDRERPNRGPRLGGGGFGGGGDDDPPPPYDSDYRPPPKKQSAPRTYPYTPRSSTRSPRSSNADTAQGGWRPGPWTSAAAGAAAGFAAGRSTRGAQPQQQQVPPAPRPPQTQQRNGSGWLFGDTGGAGSSSSSPSYSSGRNESTGFGSTSRR